MAGFPFWPSRYCSEPELQELIKRYKAPKSHAISISVRFLGLTLEK